MDDFRTINWGEVANSFNINILDNYLKVKA